MTKRKWKSGAPCCWWAIVPKERDPYGPMPWMVGHTRKLAWDALYRHLRGHAINVAEWTAVRVFLVEAE